MTEECEDDGDEEEKHASKREDIYVTEIQPNARRHPLRSLHRSEFARPPTDSRVPPQHQLEYSSPASAGLR